MRLHLLCGAASLCLLTAISAHAADVAAASDSAGAEVQELVVTSQGQTRQVNAITAAQIESLAPGSSPIKAIALLPGVNFQSSDPFGAYEWAVRISVRGFNQNQLGFTLDGVPLGDMSYGNYNGLHISRAIASENIGQSVLSEGVGGLATASSSNLGGALEFTSRDPSHSFSVLAAVTGGTYQTHHEFIRLDSGDVASGGRGYLSFSDQSSKKWKGLGYQHQIQINGKYVQPLGDKATLTTFLNYSDRRENDYQDLALVWLPQFGYKLDNNSFDFPLAVKMAQAYQNGTPYPAPFTNTPDAIDAAYFNASGLRQDIIGAARLDWTVTDGLTAHLTGYGHHNKGAGLWYTPYVPSPGGAPISVRTTEYDVTRGGAIGSLDYKVGRHDIEGGIWFESNTFNQARRFYALNAAGTNIDSLQFPTNPFFTQWQGAFTTKTVDLHLQDSWQVTDALKVNLGFKSLFVDVSARQTIGDHAAGDIKSDRGFLPQVGANYRLNETSEVFADYAQNMRAFVGANTAGPLSATQAGFDAIKNKLKPETSQTGEIGYRFHSGPIEASIAGYYVKFDNRLLAVQVGAGIIGNPSALENVGSVTSKGVELGGKWKMLRDLTLTGSYAYNRSTYDDNVVDGNGGVVATRGKILVDSPEHIGNVSLQYDNGSLYGGVDVSMMSKRYFTYLNDQSVPGHAVVDLNIGYRFRGGSPLLKGLEVQANIANALNNRYYSTIGSNGYGNAGDNDTLQAASPVQAYITVRKSF